MNGSDTLASLRSNKLLFAISWSITVSEISESTKYSTSIKVSFPLALHLKIPATNGLAYTEAAHQRPCNNDTSVPGRRQLNGKLLESRSEVKLKDITDTGMNEATDQHH